MIVRPKPINCLVHISFILKMGQAEAKKFGLFEKKKNISILPVSYLICSAKQMLFRSPMYDQNKGEGVPFNSSFLCFLYHLYLLCIFLFICIYLCKNTYKYANNYKWMILVKKAQKGFLDGFGIFWKKKFFFQFFYSKVL